MVTDTENFELLPQLKDQDQDMGEIKRLTLVLNLFNILVMVILISMEQNECLCPFCG